jgi:cell wall-associated NlpC family hydrolase
MRRFILGPVICALILGFIWADFGQAAQAQTTSKKEVKSVAEKKHKNSKKITNMQARLSSKKTNASKKKTKHALAGDGNKTHRKTVHAKNTKTTKAHKRNHTQSSSSHTDIKPALDYELPTMPPSDLWLAKDSPDLYKEVMYDGQLDEQTIKILESAYSYLGTPYRWGGTTPSGFDCSGFVRYVFNENGIPLSRSSQVQAHEGKSVSLSDLRPGDLIFFKMHHRIRDHYRVNHVGLYVGNGQFIHASCNSRTHAITVEDLDSEHYFPRIVEVRRVLENMN